MSGVNARRVARDDEQVTRARSSGLLVAVIAFLVVPAWGVVDHLFEPSQARLFIMVRLGCELPILVCLCLLWRHPLGRRRPELLTLLVLAVVQGEIGWMIGRATNERDLYLLGFSLALYGSGSVMGGRHHWTLAVVATTWLSLVGGLWLAPNPVPSRDLTAAAFYLSTASLIGLISHIQRERLSDREFAARLRLELEQEHAVALMARLERLSNEDPLTALANRRRWEADLDAACARVRNVGGSLAVLLIDIDHFKDINDRHGHSGGDLALCEVANLLRSKVRSGDLAARLGGDEYGVLLPGCDSGCAAEIADTIRRSTCELDLACGGLTLSLGVAAVEGPSADPEQLMRRADAQLYRAKSTRNSVAA